MISKLLTPLYEWTYFTLTDGPKPISRMMFWIDDVLRIIPNYIKLVLAMLNDRQIYRLESCDEWEIRMIEELNEEDTDDCTIWTPTDES